MTCRPAVLLPSCGLGFLLIFLDGKIVRYGERIVEDERFLSTVTLFVEFDAEELDHLRKSLHTSRFGPGDAILEEGNANRALHVVKSGRIRVSRKVQDREVTL